MSQQSALCNAKHRCTAHTETFSAWSGHTKTLWTMSWDTLCKLNQFARSAISIIAGVWHGGQTLSALCSALLKVLTHRKITLGSKYWLKRFYVLRTGCSPWTMSPGGIRLRRRSDHFPVFLFFSTEVALLYEPPRCGSWISSDFFPAFSPSSPSSKCSCCTSEGFSLNPLLFCFSLFINVDFVYIVNAMQF